VCFLLAALALGLRERRLRQAVGEQRLAFGLLALALIPFAVAGPDALLGYYDSVLDLGLDPLAIGKWAAADAMLVLYSSGWVLAPGAVLGLALAVWRPRSRAELAFGVFASLFSLAVIFQAGLYAANGADRIQERYFFYVVPVAFLAFGLFASRGWPHRVPHALLAGVLIAVSARVPLAGFAASDGRSNSPLLFSAGELENLIGDRGLASLAIAAAVALLSLAAALLGFRPRRATGIAIALGLGACALSSAGAVAYDHALSTRVRANVVPGNPSIVDDSELGDAALVQSPLGDKGFATEELFWNRSLKSLVLMPGTPLPDAFAVEHAQIGRDGTLLTDGKPLTRPMLVDSYGATMRFRGAREVARTRLYRLLQPSGRPRLADHARRKRCRTVELLALPPELGGSGRRPSPPPGWPAGRFGATRRPGRRDALSVLPGSVASSFLRAVHREHRPALRQRPLYGANLPARRRSLPVGPDMSGPGGACPAPIRSP
jgi:hypothetical protein